jgi:superfamily II DNA or RNA helicase
MTHITAAGPLILETPPACNSATSFALRPYQEDAVKAVFTSWEQIRTALLVMPTAGGKTIVFAAIIQRLLAEGVRVLVLVHRDELLSQSRDKLRRASGLIAATEKAGDWASVYAGVIVASVQTLSRKKRIERFARDHFGCIITDEAHHSLAVTYRRTYDWFPEAKMLGITATPDRGDKRTLAEIYQDIAYEISMLDLIKQGYLCPIKIETIPLEIDIREVKTVAGDYSADDLGNVLGPWLEAIADILATQYKDRRTLVFVPLIAISQEFAALCRARGLAAEHIDGTSSDRAEILERFRSGETTLLSNAMLLLEGYDEPAVDCVVVLRPTKVRALYAQAVGRGTRIHPRKDHLVILDFLWLSTTVRK